VEIPRGRVEPQQETRKLDGGVIWLDRRLAGPPPRRPAYRGRSLTGLFGEASRLLTPRVRSVRADGDRVVLGRARLVRGAHTYVEAG